MNLTTCLYIKTETITELERSLVALKATRAVLALTYPDVSMDWMKKNDSLIVFGSKVELAIVEQVFRVSLGLFVEVGETTTSAFNSVETVARSLGITDDNSEEEVAVEGWTDEEIERVEEAHELANSTALSELERCNNAYGTNDDDCYARDSLADRLVEELRMANDVRDNPMVDESIRVSWQVVYDRLTEVPNPTESASGQFSRQEQIDYSEAYNPRHWNLVKTRFNGRTSGHYLSYICPPSVDMYDTLRIIGGPNVHRTPAQFEICVYNTEPYWRELRHQMHQGTTFLREVVAA